MEWHDRWSGNVLHYEKPSQEYVNEAMRQIENVVRGFCEISEFDFERIKCNMTALEDVIVRVDMRTLYFSVFHQEMKPNEYKRLAGLLIFWLLKRHPFWIDVLGTDDEVVHLAACINEKIALHIAVSLLNDYNSDFFEHGEDLVES